MHTDLGETELGTSLYVKDKEISAPGSLSEK